MVNNIISLQLFFFCRDLLKTMLLHKILKGLSIFILSLLMLVVIIIMTINLSAVRKQLVNIINKNLTKKEIPVHLGALNAIKFSQINISDLLIFGEKKDTILFSGNLDVHIAARNLIHHKITVLSFEVNGLYLRLLQETPEQPLNLIEAFSHEQDTINRSKNDSSSWIFDISNIKLTSLDLRFENVPGRMLANIRLQEADVKINKMDLKKKELNVSFI